MASLAPLARAAPKATQDPKRLGPNKAKSQPEVQRTAALHPPPLFTKPRPRASVGEPVQAKLDVSQPDDEFEKEADEVAEKVMRMPDPAAPVPPPNGDGGGSAGGTNGNESNIRTSPSAPKIRPSPPPAKALVARAPSEMQRLEVEDEDEMEDDQQPAAMIQRSVVLGGGRLLPKAAPGASAARPSGESSFTTRLREAKSAGGTALPAGVRQFMEPRFGRDFSDVHIHTDARADWLSRGVSARAFTTGADIFFKPSEFRPHAAEGRRLIAHELAHVVQQRGAVADDTAGSMASQRLFRADDDTTAELPLGAQQAPDVLVETPAEVVILQLLNEERSVAELVKAVANRPRTEREQRREALLTALQAEAASAEEGEMRRFGALESEINFEFDEVRRKEDEAQARAEVEALEPKLLKLAVLGGLPKKGAPIAKEWDRLKAALNNYTKFSLDQEPGKQELQKYYRQLKPFHRETVTRKGGRPSEPVYVHEQLLAGLLGAKKRLQAWADAKVITPEVHREVLIRIDRSATSPVLRRVKDKPKPSNHSFGLAIDVDAKQNPMFTGDQLTKLRKLSRALGLELEPPILSRKNLFKEVSKADSETVTKQVLDEAEALRKRAKEFQEILEDEIKVQAQVAKFVRATGLELLISAEELDKEIQTLVTARQPQATDKFLMKVIGSVPSARHGRAPTLPQQAVGASATIKLLVEFRAIAIRRKGFPVMDLPAALIYALAGPGPGQLRWLGVSETVKDSMHFDGKAIDNIIR